MHFFIAMQPSQRRRWSLRSERLLGKNDQLVALDAQPLGIQRLSDMSVGLVYLFFWLLLYPPPNELSYMFPG